MRGFGRGRLVQRWTRNDLSVRIGEILARAREHEHKKRSGFTLAAGESQVEWGNAAWEAPLEGICRIELAFESALDLEVKLK